MLFGRDARDALCVGLFNAVFAHRRAEAEHALGFRLIGGDVFNAGKHCIAQRGIRRGVEHHRHAAFRGIACDGFVDVHGDLELKQHHVVGCNRFFKESDVRARKAHVRAGGYDDAVVERAVRLFREHDVADRGRTAVRNINMGNVYPFADEGLEQGAAEGVVADAADHSDLRAEARGLYGLICALAAGRSREVFTCDGLARCRHAACCDDEIHHKASDDKKTGFPANRFHIFSKLNASGSAGSGLDGSV